MEKIMRPVWAEIDLDILANNMKNIKKAKYFILPFLFIDEVYLWKNILMKQ